MGNEQKTLKIEQIAIDQSQLHQQVSECIRSKRLHFSHQSNVYIKFEYLVKHFSQFQIEELLLDHNMIRTELIQLLAKIDLKTTKQKIKVIFLNYNEIQCQCLKPIVNFNLIHLTTLYLDHNHIGNDGCYYLTKPKLQSLQTLDLTSNVISQQGARFLAMSNWPELRTLLISENLLSLKGFLYLGKGEWPQLIFVQAKNNKFQVNKTHQKTKFRSEVKGFRVQLQ